MLCNVLNPNLNNYLPIGFAVFTDNITLSRQIVAINYICNMYCDASNIFMILQNIPAN